MSLLERLKQSTEFLKPMMAAEPKLAIVLGSGWGAFANHVEEAKVFPYSAIPGFLASSVEGHAGKLVIGKVRGVPVCVLQGRVHFYEGHSMDEVVHPVRTLAQLKIPNLLLTNASGGLIPSMNPGDFMLIRDHINLSGQNPLIGKDSLALGPRFPDMTEAYNNELSELLKQILHQHKAPFTEGVYGGLSGPTYETPAEVRYLRSLGLHAVGMSTVNETIAAHHMGMKVCGLACITNLGAGITGEKLSHADITHVAQKVEKQFSGFLCDFIEQLP